MVKKTVLWREVVVVVGTEPKKKRERRICGQGQQCGDLGGGDGGRRGYRRDKR